MYIHLNKIDISDDECFIAVDADLNGRIMYDGKRWDFPWQCLTIDQRSRFTHLHRTESEFALSVLWSDGTQYLSRCRVLKAMGDVVVEEIEILDQHGSRDPIVHFRAEAVTNILREWNELYGSAAKYWKSSTTLRGHIRNGEKLKHYEFGFNKNSFEFVAIKELPEGESFDYCQDREILECHFGKWRLLGGGERSDDGLASYIWG